MPRISDSEVRDLLKSLGLPDYESEPWRAAARKALEDYPSIGKVQEDGVVAFDTYRANRLAAVRTTLKNTEGFAAAVAHAANIAALTGKEGEEETARQRARRIAADFFVPSTPGFGGGSALAEQQEFEDVWGPRIDALVLLIGRDPSITDDALTQQVKDNVQGAFTTAEREQAETNVALGGSAAEQSARERFDNEYEGRFTFVSENDDGTITARDNSGAVHTFTPSGETYIKDSGDDLSVAEQIALRELTDGTATVNADGTAVTFQNGDTYNITSDGRLTPVYPAPAGVAPQAKSAGQLSNGTYYIYDPNQPAATAFTEVGTGRVLGPDDFGPEDEYVTVTDQPTGETFRVNVNDPTDRTSLGTFAHPTADPNELTYFDDKTGESIVLNTLTGARRSLGVTGPTRTEATGFADIEADKQLQRDIDAARAGDPAAMQRVQVQQQEANRRASLEAGVRGFETAAGFIPTPLEQATFARETLRNPADFAWRAATQSGFDSPFPQVTQADVINQFNELVGGFRGALKGFNPLATFNPAVSSAPAAGVSPSAPAAGAPLFDFTAENLPNLNAGALAAIAGGGIGFGGQLSAEGLARRASELNKRFGSGQLQQADGGGIFGEPVEVHDNEVVTPIAGGGFAVIPMKKGDPKPKKSAQSGGVGGFSDFFNFSDFSTLPNFKQEQFRTAAREAPGAFNEVFAGRQRPGLRFPIPGFQLPSPQMLGSLAPEERTAFDTRIGIEGFDPRTVEHSIRQRFGGTRSQPRARLAPRSGF